MISARFAPLICALVGVALIPTFIHSYADSTVVDGRTTAAVPTTLAGYTSMPSGRSAAWGGRRFDSKDWIERVYESGGEKVRLTLVRSYDLKALYHHPELAVAYGTPFVHSRITHFSARPDIPVYVLSTNRDVGPVAMYALHYDDRFVQDPIAFQIRTAGELLFSGRKAMTLFFVTDSTGLSSSARETSPAATILFAAIDRFLAVPIHR
jgi:hypothetical protein